MQMFRGRRHDPGDEERAGYGFAARLGKPRAVEATSERWADVAYIRVQVFVTVGSMLASLGFHLPAQASQRFDIFNCGCAVYDDGH
jgi:hypothetical protein